jgi:hypothetical protein|tara:strand:+ start:2129 stop:2362 length:234 start_codon:yes stop_codon:yes gene_type:complete
MSTYCIINSSEVSSLDFSQIQDDSVNTLRYSLDQTQVVVEYLGDQPSFLSGKTEYTHSEILAIINDYDQGWKDQSVE